MGNKQILEQYDNTFRKHRGWCVETELEGGGKKVVGEINPIRIKRDFCEPMCTLQAVFLETISEKYWRINYECLVYFFTFMPSYPSLPTSNLLWSPVSLASRMDLKSVHFSSRWWTQVWWSLQLHLCQISSLGTQEGGSFLTPRLQSGGACDQLWLKMHCNSGSNIWIQGKTFQHVLLLPYQLWKQVIEMKVP